MFKRLIISLVCFTFIFSNLQYVHAQDFSINQLPVPGTMVGVSTPFAPLALKGLIVNPQKPLEFQFIVDTGKGPQDTASIKNQANQLVKYFLAGLTIPEGDLWVNLSPYEKNRMIPEALGQTDLGRDLLAQDYILKQLTASLIYPEKDLGKEFWSRVYAKAQQQFGTTNVPVNTFNKVWILPEQAQVYENVNAAYVTKSTLKVMLDEDYTALQKHMPVRNGTDSIGANLVRQIILPEIEKEVNTGKNFAPLRQIYQALILAKWYKETIQNGLLDALYTNKDKVAGVNVNDPTVKEQIYERYLKAYKKGAFNYIKEDPTPNGQSEPRKYFSGGIPLIAINLKRDGAMSAVKADGAMRSVEVNLQGNNSSTNSNLAMFSDRKKHEILDKLWNGKGSKKKIVYFTDIGTYPDDYAALWYLLHSSAVEVVAVVNSGNAILNAGQAINQKKFLQGTSYSEVPVYGEDDAKDHIPQILADKNVDFLSTGSLTAVQKVLSEVVRNERLKDNVSGIFVMGGSFKPYTDPMISVSKPATEWNLGFNLQASNEFFRLVKENQLKCYMVPLEGGRFFQVKKDAFNGMGKRMFPLAAGLKRIFDQGDLDKALEKERFVATDGTLQHPLYDIFAAMALVLADNLPWEEVGLTDFDNNPLSGADLQTMKLNNAVENKFLKSLPENFSDEEGSHYAFLANDFVRRVKGENSVLATQEDLNIEEVVAELNRLEAYGDGAEAFFTSTVVNRTPSQGDFADFQKEFSAETLDVERKLKDIGQYNGKNLQELVYEYLAMMYRWIPRPLFKRFYTDNTFTPAHGLSHIIDVLKYSLGIIKQEKDNLQINIDNLIMAILMHDISAIFSHEDHPQHSALWAGALLSKERQFNPNSINEGDIDAVTDIMLGHIKKATQSITSGRYRTVGQIQDQYDEAKVIHDADRLAVILHPERIYQAWQPPTIEINEKVKGKVRIDTGEGVKFFNPNESLDNRIKVIMNNERYMASDGVTDLYRKVIYPRKDISSNHFLTAGANDILKSETNGVVDSINFIKGHAQIPNEDKNRIISILKELDRAMVTAEEAKEKLKRWVDPQYHGLIKWEHIKTVMDFTEGPWGGVIIEILDKEANAPNLDDPILLEKYANQLGFTLAKADYAVPLCLDQ